MFVYTPNHEMLCDFNRAKEKDQSGKRNNHSSFAYAYAKTVCRSDQERMVSFMKHWGSSRVYSSKKLEYVLIHGVKFPVQFFDEAVI